MNSTSHPLIMSLLYICILRFADYVSLKSTSLSCTSGTWLAQHCNHYLADCMGCYACCLADGGKGVFIMLSTIGGLLAAYHTRSTWCTFLVILFYLHNYVGTSN